MSEMAMLRQQSADNSFRIADYSSRWQTNDSFRVAIRPERRLSFSTTPGKHYATTSGLTNCRLAAEPQFAQESLDDPEHVDLAFTVCVFLPASCTHFKRGVCSGSSRCRQRYRFPLVGCERRDDAQNEPKHLEHRGNIFARVQIQPRVDGVSREQRSTR